MKSFKYILLLVGFIAFTSCEELETFNENPNAPTIDQASPSLILPKITYEVGDQMALRGWNLGNVVMQLVATNNFTANDIYAWGTETSTWNLLFRNARDAQNLIGLGEGLNNVNYIAIGRVLKAYCFLTLTEMYGDIPYSQALSGQTEEIFQPVYDNQRDIYVDILKELAESNSQFDEVISIEGDIMFGGDIARWKKFTNSLRIRTIMRLEQKWDEVGLSAADLAKIVDDEPIMEDLSDSALLPYLSVGANRWPLHTSRIGSFEEKRMSQTIEVALKDMEDPRLETYFRPIANPDSAEFVIYRGIPNGLSEDNAINYNGGPKNQSTLGTRFREEPDAVDMVFMHYPELQFILAEAAEKGYIDGDAAEYYANGVEGAMAYYDLAVTDAYMSQIGVDLSKAADQEGRLELIAKQKWLSLLMVGLEAWFDYRRTGLPAITPGQDALFDEVPVRIQYPSDEQSLNGNNYDAVISSQGPDEITTKMWLLQ